MWIIWGHKKIFFNVNDGLILTSLTIGRVVKEPLVVVIFLLFGHGENVKKTLVE